MKATRNEDNLGRTNSDSINRGTAFFVMKNSFLFPVQTNYST